MPSLAARSCATPGCRNSAHNGARCKDCERQHKGSSTERGYDSQHQRLRILAFERDGWRCVDCGWRPQVVVDCERYGVDAPPTAVILAELTQSYHSRERHLHADHELPIERRPDLAHDLGNYRTRCSACHWDKTQRGS